MPKLPPGVLAALRLLSIATGAGLFADLVWRAGPGILWQNLVRLGWGFPLVVGLAGVAHLAKTWAWQMTLGKDQHKVSFPRLVGLRLAAEAPGQFGILGQTFGDSIRIARLSRQIKQADSLASVTLDRGLYLVTGLIVAIVGTLAALPALSLSRGLCLYAEWFVGASLAFLFLTLLAVRGRWPILSGGARLLGRLPTLEGWIDQRFEMIQSTENALFDFHHKTPPAFWASFSLNLAAQCLAILEVCCILWLLGAQIGFFSALIIEGLTKLLNAIGSLNPGNVGTYEGGNILISKIFSLSSATGLALAVARRLRALFWTAVGCICLLLLTRSKKRNEFGTAEKERTIEDSRTTAEGSSGHASSSVAIAVFLSPTDASRAKTNLRAHHRRR